MSETVLAVSGLRKGYGTGEVLQDVSFTLEAGSALALTGPKGAGKSTLVRILAGLELPDSGTVSLLGSGNDQELCKARRETGFVPETPAGYENQTVYRNLLLRAELYGRPDLAWLRELRRELRLTEKYHVGRTEKLRAASPSTSRRYALACALVHKPRLLILDEPFAGLEREELEAVTLFLARLREEGTAMLLTAEDPAEAEGLCSRVLTLRDGRVTA